MADGFNRDILGVVLGVHSWSPKPLRADCWLGVLGAAQKDGRSPVRASVPACRGVE